MRRTYFIEKNFNLVMLAVLISGLVLAYVAEGFAAAENVRAECFRLHVIANSDSEEDQAVKLIVRDALLEAGAALFTENTDAYEAEKKIAENKELLTSVVEQVLKENGIIYGCEIVICEEFFDTREYDGVSLPAGVYKACKVILGDGEGKNWWCVMFPPLCIPATAKNSDEVFSVFGENGGSLVTGKSGYVIKFKLVEIFEEVADALKKR